MKQNAQWKAARSIVEALQNHGFEAVIVGGAVRDLLIGRDPGDVDVATEAKPWEVKSIFPKTADVGIDHGTVMVLKQGQPVEVTTYRTEGEYSDHRRPDRVEFVTSLKEDMRRRDFTMNALAISKDQEIIDYFEGTTDIQNRVIRAVGNPTERFSEDALRMLRAIRFASQLNFNIEEHTFKAIRELSPSISHIAVERVKTEFDKIFLSPCPEKGIGLLFESGLASYLPMIGNYKVTEHIHTWEHFNAFDNAANGWAFLLLTAAIDEVDGLARSYKLSNAERKHISALLKAVQIRKEQRWTPLHYYRFQEDILIAAESYTSIIYRTDALPADSIKNNIKDLVILSRSDIPIKGDDLIEWSGYKGGPWVKEWLHKIEEAVVLREIENERERIREWFLHEFNNNK